MDIKDFKFDDKGLVCAIAQDVKTGEVLMQAYMNAEALQATLDSGYATYFSRSRGCLWKKVLRLFSFLVLALIVSIHL